MTSTQWGRNNTPSFLTTVSLVLLFFTLPFFAFMFQCVNSPPFNGSFQNLKLLLSEEPISFCVDSISTSSITNTSVILAIWILFQFVLYLIPDYFGKFLQKIGVTSIVYRGGIQYGQITPAGNKLAYNVNGLQALVITLIMFCSFHYTGALNGSWIASNWIPLFISANIFGYVLTFAFYARALAGSKHATQLLPLSNTGGNDNRYSGSVMYDIIMGVELNPRITIVGNEIDLKLFLNGRPGIIGWMIINLSFAIKQYETFGTISNTMVMVNILQGIYVVDFFWNESWYLRTIDIAHDHLGWYLAWGDMVWLPFMYTLQSSYLSNNFVVIGTPAVSLIMSMGLFGYCIFRLANSQKDRFRQNCNNNGIVTESFIECTYITSDGIHHESKLLTSGCWGIARHINYTGDLVLSLAFCMSCGFDNLLPYFYFVYMMILLGIRAQRDDQKCKEKYGQYWEKYCSVVRYQFVPYIY